jgi:hypothetical protein
LFLLRADLFDSLAYPPVIVLLPELFPRFAIPADRVNARPAECLLKEDAHPFDARHLFDHLVD